MSEENLFGGVEIPSDFKFYPEIANPDVIYPPCKYCGKNHGMGIENMVTREIKPLDICNACLWKKPHETPPILVTEGDCGLLDTKKMKKIMRKVELGIFKNMSTKPGGPWGTRS